MIGILSKIFNDPVEDWRPSDALEEVDRSLDGIDEASERAMERGGDHADAAYERGQEALAQQEDKTGERKVAIDAEAEVDLSLMIHAEGEYRDFQGDQNSWSHTQDVEVSVDFDLGGTMEQSDDFLT